MVHQIYKDALMGIRQHERKVCEESRQIIEESYRMVIFITLEAKMSGETMCGIDINEVKAQEEIKKTLKQIIDWAYL